MADCPCEVNGFLLMGTKRFCRPTKWQLTAVVLKGSKLNWVDNKLKRHHIDLSQLKALKTKIRPGQVGKINVTLKDDHVWKFHTATDKEFRFWTAMILGSAGIPCSCDVVTTTTTTTPSSTSPTVTTTPSTISIGSWMDDTVSIYKAAVELKGTKLRWVDNKLYHRHIDLSHWTKLSLQRGKDPDWVGEINVTLKGDHVWKFHTASDKEFRFWVEAIIKAVGLPIGVDWETQSSITTAPSSPSPTTTTTNTPSSPSSTATTTPSTNSIGSSMDDTVNVYKVEVKVDVRVETVNRVEIIQPATDDYSQLTPMTTITPSSADGTDSDLGSNITFNVDESESEGVGSEVVTSHYQLPGFGTLLALELPRGYVSPSTSEESDVEETNSTLSTTTSTFSKTSSSSTTSTEPESRSLTYTTSTEGLTASDIEMDTGSEGDIDESNEGSSAHPNPFKGRKLVRVIHRRVDEWFQPVEPSVNYTVAKMIAIGIFLVAGITVAAASFYLGH